MENFDSKEAGNCRIEREDTNMERFRMELESLSQNEEFARVVCGCFYESAESYSRRG